MDERELIRAVLREINYLWGLRNASTQDLFGLFDHPFAESRHELRTTFENNVLSRVEGRRNETHPARPVPFSERLDELSGLPAHLDCDTCCGVGVLTDGGICTVCDGSGMDLTKRVDTPFSLWAKTRAAGIKSG